MIPFASFKDAALVLLDETFLGRPDGQDYTWIVEGNRGGIFDSIESLSASEASFKPTSDTNSIAAHVNHLRQALAWSNAEARGEETVGDWEATWLVQSVESDPWDRLRADLRREYDEFREHAVGTSDPPSTDWVLGMMVAPAHALYHLGAIRQIMKSAKADAASGPIGS